MNTMRNIPATKQDVETAIEKAVDPMADIISKGFAHHDMQFDASNHDWARLNTCSSRSKRGNWRAWKHGSNASKTPSPSSHTAKAAMPWRLLLAFVCTLPHRSQLKL
jgi:hypothetical protein